MFKYADEAGYKNLEFTAIVVLAGENADKNVAAYHDTLEEISNMED